MGSVHSVKTKYYKLSATGLNLIGNLKTLTSSTKNLCNELNFSLLVLFRGHFQTAAAIMVHFVVKNLRSLSVKSQTHTEK